MEILDLQDQGLNSVPESLRWLNASCMAQGEDPEYQQALQSLKDGSVKVSEVC